MKNHHCCARLSTFVFFIVLLGVSSHLALSQTDNDRNFARGFEPGQTYHDFGADKVNILNGNLTVSIPIGPVLKHNGDLSLQLNLHYNSKIWATEPRTLNEDFMRVAYLEGRSTAGLGWKMHLGRLYLVAMDSSGYSAGSEVYFESQDGNRHRLYPENLTNPESGYWYTKDNSYIRAEYTEVSPGIDHWTLWLPSGEIYMMGYYIPHNEDYTTAWQCHDDEFGYHDCFRGHYTTRIEDRFGNTINVDYFDKQESTYRCMKRIWFEDIGDGNENNREITFVANDYFDFGEGAGSEYIDGGYIDQIIVPAVAPSDNSAVYQLNYYSNTSYPEIQYPAAEGNYWNDFNNDSLV